MFRIGFLFLSLFCVCTKGWSCSVNVFYVTSTKYPFVNESFEIYLYGNVSNDFEVKVTQQNCDERAIFSRSVKESLHQDKTRNTSGLEANQSHVELRYHAVPNVSVEQDGLFTLCYNAGSGWEIAGLPLRIHRNLHTESLSILVGALLLAGFFWGLVILFFSHGCRRTDTLMCALPVILAWLASVWIMLKFAVVIGVALGTGATFGFGFVFLFLESRRQAYRVVGFHRVAIIALFVCFCICQLVSVFIVPFFDFVGTAIVFATIGLIPIVFAEHIERRPSWVNLCREHYPTTPWADHLKPLVTVLTKDPQYLLRLQTACIFSSFSVLLVYFLYINSLSRGTADGYVAVSAMIIVLSIYAMDGLIASMRPILPAKKRSLAIRFFIRLSMVIGGPNYWYAYCSVPFIFLASYLAYVAIMGTCEQRRCKPSCKLSPSQNTDGTLDPKQSLNPITEPDASLLDNKDDTTQPLSSTVGGNTTAVTTDLLVSIPAENEEDPYGDAADDGAKDDQGSASTNEGSATSAAFSGVGPRLRAAICLAFLLMGYGTLTILATKVRCSMLGYIYVVKYGFVEQYYCGLISISIVLVVLFSLVAYSKGALKGLVGAACLGTSAVGIFWWNRTWSHPILVVSLCIPVICGSAMIGFAWWKAHDYHEFPKSEPRLYRRCIAPACLAVFVTSTILMGYGLHLTLPENTVLDWSISAFILVPSLTVLTGIRGRQRMVFDAFYIGLVGFNLVAFFAFSFGIWFGAVSHTESIAEYAEKSFLVFSVSVGWLWISLVAFAFLRLHEDEWRISPVSQRLFISGGVCEIGVLVFLANLLPVITFLACLVLLWIFASLVVIYVRWKNSGDFWTRGWHIYYRCTLMVTFLFGALVGVATGNVFAGFTATHGLLFLVALARASNTWRQVNGLVYYSPFLLPAYTLDPDTKCLVDANRTVWLLLRPGIMLLFWGQACALLYWPPYGGYCVSAVALLLMCTGYCEMASLPSKQISEYESYITKDIISRALSSASNELRNLWSADLLGLVWNDATQMPELWQHIHLSMTFTERLRFVAHFHMIAIRLAQEARKRTSLESSQLGIAFKQEEELTRGQSSFLLKHHSNLQESSRRIRDSLARFDALRTQRSVARWMGGGGAGASGASFDPRPPTSPLSATSTTTNTTAEPRGSDGKEGEREGVGASSIATTTTTVPAIGFEGGTVMSGPSYKSVSSSNTSGGPSGGGGGRLLHEHRPPQLNTSTLLRPSSMRGTVLPYIISDDHLAELIAQLRALHPNGPKFTDPAFSMEPRPLCLVRRATDVIPNPTLERDRHPSQEESHNYFLNSILSSPAVRMDKFLDTGYLTESEMLQFGLFPFFFWDDRGHRVRIVVDDYLYFNSIGSASPNLMPNSNALSVPRQGSFSSYASSVSNFGVALAPPANPPTSFPRPVFAQSRNPHSLWASLLEKAYAKWLGGYDHLPAAAGAIPKVLEDFTGGVCEVFDFGTEDTQIAIATNALWEELLQGHRVHHICHVSTFPTQAQGSPITGSGSGMAGAATPSTTAAMAQNTSSSSSSSSAVVGNSTLQPPASSTTPTSAGSMSRSSDSGGSYGYLPIAYAVLAVKQVDGMRLVKLRDPTVDLHHPGPAQRAAQRNRGGGAANETIPSPASGGSPNRQALPIRIVDFSAGGSGPGGVGLGGWKGIRTELWPERLRRKTRQLKPERGTLWATWEDIATHFRCLSICRIFPASAKWFRQSEDVRWLSRKRFGRRGTTNYIIEPNYGGFHAMPQWRIRCEGVRDRVPIFIRVTQLDHLPNGTFHPIRVYLFNRGGGAGGLPCFDPCFVGHNSHNLSALLRRRYSLQGNILHRSQSVITSCQSHPKPRTASPSAAHHTPTNCIRIWGMGEFTPQMISKCSSPAQSSFVCKARIYPNVDYILIPNVANGMMLANSRSDFRIRVEVFSLSNVDMTPLHVPHSLPPIRHRMDCRAPVLATIPSFHISTKNLAFSRRLDLTATASLQDVDSPIQLASYCYISLGSEFTDRKDRTPVLIILRQYCAAESSANVLVPIQLTALSFSKIEESETERQPSIISDHRSCCKPKFKHCPQWSLRDSGPYQALPSVAVRAHLIGTRRLVLIPSALAPSLYSPPSCATCSSASSSVNRPPAPPRCDSAIYEEHRRTASGGFGDDSFRGRASGGDCVRKIRVELLICCDRELTLGRYEHMEEIAMATVTSPTGKQVTTASMAPGASGSGIDPDAASPVRTVSPPLSTPCTATPEGSGSTQPPGIPFQTPSDHSSGLFQPSGSTQPANAAHHHNPPNPLNPLTSAPTNPTSNTAQATSPTTAGPSPGTPTSNMPLLPVPPESMVSLPATGQDSIDLRRNSAGQIATTQPQPAKPASGPTHSPTSDHRPPPPTVTPAPPPVPSPPIIDGSLAQTHTSTASSDFSSESVLTNRDPGTIGGGGGGHYGSAAPFTLITTNLKRWQASGILLGRGTFGQVYLGLGEEGENVAIKVLPITSDPKKMQMTRREVEFMQTLSHPNIVHLLASAIHNGSLYIVMEKMDASLEKVLQIYGKINETPLRSYTRQTLSALQYLHNQGVVHRDVKPANVLVTANGTVKVVDFGLASANDATMSCARGTPIFMAPEAWRQESSFKSDVWSVGIMTWVLFTGESPFPPGLPPITLSYRVNSEDMTKRIPASFPPALASFVTCCLQLTVDNRSDCTQLLAHPFIVGNKHNNTSTSPTTPPPLPLDKVLGSTTDGKSSSSPTQRNGSHTPQRRPSIPSMATGVPTSPQGAGIPAAARAALNNAMISSPPKAATGQSGQPSEAAPTPTSPTGPPQAPPASKSLVELSAASHVLSPAQIPASATSPQPFNLQRDASATGGTRPKSRRSAPLVIDGTLPLPEAAPSPTTNVTETPVLPRLIIPRSSGGGPLAPVGVSTPGSYNTPPTEASGGGVGELVPHPPGGGGAGAGGGRRVQISDSHQFIPRSPSPSS